MKVKDKRSNEVIPVFCAEYAGNNIRIFPIEHSIPIRDIPRDKVEIIFNVNQPWGCW